MSDLSRLRVFIAVAEAVGVGLRIRVQVRSFDAMCRMVARGLGIAVLSVAVVSLSGCVIGG